ncbi:MAG: carbohydrate ABC transporter permease [Firmicutes bacterium]|jgi:multiple sugar transport system permease protein/raffinose/stachyose/melibiose transport system permease protein|nr:carbohydrate ABC transporter permease [Bacillota bacterium]
MVRIRREDLIRLLVLGFLAVLTIAPFVITLFISFKTEAQFIRNPFGLSLPLHWSNYATAWAEVRKYLFNSIFACSIACVGALTTATLAAYAFARFSFWLDKFLFYVLMFLIMLPPIMSLVPRFLMVKRLGLLNTYGGLILPFMSGSQVTAMFILRSFFSGINESIFDAAQLDGASEGQILVRIVLPLSAPVLWTLAIMNIMTSWNNILWPLITLSSRELYPVTVGLMFFQGQYAIQRGPLMAGYIISSIPLVLLFMFASKSFIRGLSSGAVKM